MIDLRLLTLIAVAEERNFTKAAEKLNLTQPAVSHHIKDLEDELNTQLFIRKKRGYCFDSRRGNRVELRETLFGDVRQTETGTSRK
jgi:LysR family transcriptional regulator for metE and metH